MKRHVSWRALVIVLLICVFVNGASTAYALPMQRDCYGEYEQYLNWSWQQLDACIVSTNDDSAWSRLTIRTGCNIAWVARSTSAASQFMTCSALPIR